MAALSTDGIDTTSGIYSIEGMSGSKYRWFVNALARSIEKSSYLEIGSWAGSTFCSAIHNNQIMAVAIDNWSTLGGPRELFYRNLNAYKSPDTHVRVIEEDFRKVHYRELGPFNIYLFDGPHEKQDQFDALKIPYAALDDEFVFIVDDWNWKSVRAGTLEAIDHCGLHILYSAEIRTTLDDSHPNPLFAFRQSDWHNGYFISVLSKNGFAKSV